MSELQVRRELAEARGVLRRVLSKMEAQYLQELQTRDVYDRPEELLLVYAALDVPLPQVGRRGSGWPT